MAVLVTGGAGFIGSHVAEVLSKQGQDVVVLDDLTGGARDNLASFKADFVQGSVCDVDLVEGLFSKHRFTHVFHLAAYAAEGLSHFIRRFNYNNNLVGSINLINASVNYGVKTFVFTSSIAVYGEAHPPVTEDMVPMPEDPYGISKLAVELDLKNAQKMFGLDYVIFRPHNVYGERQNIGDKYRNVIGIFMNQIMQGQPMTIFGDGLQSRAFTYISDVAPVIARCVDVPAARNQVFNLGADREYTLNELAQAVADAMGVQPDVRHLPARNEVTHIYANHEKAAKVFGKGQPVALDDGLCRMAEWVKQVGARASQKFGNIEISRNLPPSWL